MSRRAGILKRVPASASGNNQQKDMTMKTTTFDTSRFARAYGWMQNKTDLTADDLIDLLMDLRIHCSTAGIPYRTCDRIAEDQYEGVAP